MTCDVASTPAFPTVLTLQAYRESNRPYRELWDDGHWVVAIGHDKRRIYLKTLPHSIEPGLPTKSYASAGTTWTGANASANGAARSWSKDNSFPATTSTWIEP